MTEPKCMALDGEYCHPEKQLSLSCRLAHMAPYSGPIWHHILDPYSTNLGMGCILHCINNKYQICVLSTNLHSGNFFIGWIKSVICWSACVADICCASLFMLCWWYGGWWGGCYHSLCMAPAPWTYKDTCGASPVQETCAHTRLASLA